MRCGRALCLSFLGGRGAAAQWCGALWCSVVRRRRVLCGALCTIACSAFLWPSRAGGGARVGACTLFVAGAGGRSGGWREIENFRAREGFFCACWYIVCMAVSRFFCFPIQMNFAENKKWPTSARWQGGVVNGVVGYMRRGSKPKGTPGSWGEPTEAKCPGGRFWWAPIINPNPVPYLADSH